MVRSLAAFLSIQVPSETELRLQPTTDLQLSAKAQQVGTTPALFMLLCNIFLKPNSLICCFVPLWAQMLLMLETMSSNKQYAELQEALDKAIQFIRYPGHCVRDGPRLLALLVNLLYPDLGYLHVIRLPWLFFPGKGLKYEGLLAPGEYPWRQTNTWAQSSQVVTQILNLRLL